MCHKLNGFESSLVLQLSAAIWPFCWFNFLHGIESLKPSVHRSALLCSCPLLCGFTLSFLNVISCDLALTEFSILTWTSDFHCFGALGDLESAQGPRLAHMYAWRMGSDDSFCTASDLFDWQGYFLNCEKNRKKLDFIREIFNAQASQAHIGIKHVYQQTILMIKNCWCAKLLINLAGTCGEAKWIVEASLWQWTPLFLLNILMWTCLCVKTC